MMPKFSSPGLFFRSGSLNSGSGAKFVDAPWANIWNSQNMPISAFGKTLIDDADAAAARATLGLVIGADVAPVDLPRATGAPQRGKCLAAAANVTIAAGSAAGSLFTIYNDSGGAITLIQGAGLTLRLAGGATTGNRTLAPRGFATIWFNASGEAIARGDVT
jgi:hypothetical protein